MVWQLVLDTNVVLDWLVFLDPSVDCLRDALHGGRVQIVGCAAIEDELSRVLAYPALRLPSTRQIEVLGNYRAQAISARLPANFGRDNLQLPDRFPRCRDSDDDVFLAVCYHARAKALISRDKALLKLRRRAARWDVAIASVTELPALVASQ